MITTEDHKQGAGRWSHKEQSLVGKYILPKAASTVMAYITTSVSKSRSGVFKENHEVLTPNAVHVSFGASVQGAKINITAGVVIHPVACVRVPEVMDDDVGERKEETREPP